MNDTVKRHSLAMCLSNAMIFQSMDDIFTQKFDHWDTNNFVLVFAIIFLGLKNHLQTKFAKILLMIIFLYIVQLQQIFNCYFCFHSELLKHEVVMTDDGGSHCLISRIEKVKWRFIFCSPGGLS